MEHADWVSAIATAIASVIAGLGLVISAVGLFVSASAVRVSAAIGIENQRSNVILHCSSRYDELYRYGSELSDKERISDDNIQAFFRRYWGLQSDQIDYWLAGYVDPETLSSWLVSTLEYLRAGDQSGFSFVRGWGFVKGHHRVVNPTLHSFVEKFTSLDFESSDEDYCQIVVFMGEIEREQMAIVSKLSSSLKYRFTTDQLVETLPTHLRNRVLAIRSHRRRA